MGASATYYDILRVSRRTAPEGVRTAYRRLAQKYHPDKLPGNADAVRIMAMLNEAYGVLSDAERRAHYDRRIEDERVQRTGHRRATTADVPTAAWPWYLLFATAAFAAAAVGTVVYKALVPAVAVAAAAALTVAPAEQTPAPAVHRPKAN
jgi:curved DNA-binding protein CbpA